jgi:asparagine synthase (glutamine-hydrolysing)
MCGLAGIFDTRAARAIQEPSLRRMTAAIRHRGPDGDGFHVEPGLGLGHRRLAIIDIGGGDQPMYNEDGSVVIVFNGEIYNHNDLRPELEAAGHVFRSRCDTEAIVHAWESWGPRCLDRFSGMFAFVLWDRNRGQLFLARDRLGKKPLYYATLDDGRFVFASELQALTALPGLPRRLNPASVEDFFAYGYIPDPDTIYEGVQRLPAAHYLLLQRDGVMPKPQPYWQARFAPGRASEAEAVEELIPLLKSCVAKRLIADVPLDAFLSGGVDSGAVVALAAGLHDGPLSTFTIDFEGEADERRFAELVARRYGTAHHADGTAIDYIKAAREQAAIFAEPFGDSSSVPTHRVSALARRD